MGFNSRFKGLIQLLV